MKQKVTEDDYDDCLCLTLSQLKLQNVWEGGSVRLMIPSTVTAPVCHFKQIQMGGYVKQVLISTIRALF